MKLKVVVAALLSGLIAISAAEARGPYGSISVGNWKGGAFTNDQTGMFSHCLGACLNSRCSIVVESDSSFGHEQVFSPLEYRSDAASAAECAGLRAERPCLAVYRGTGAGEPRSQGDHLQLCERARAAAV